MLTTPEQMAMVAAAVANKGVIMEPHAVDRVVSPSGGDRHPHQAAEVQARDDARTPQTT